MGNFKKEKNKKNGFFCGNGAASLLFLPMMQENLIDIRRGWP
jgi:hypothetical protein